MSKWLSIAGNTLTETVRQPIYGVLMWSVFGLLVLNPSIAAFSLEAGSDNKIMQDVALSTMLLFGLLASVFSAAGVITREIESATVMTVISKPVSRPLFLLGKFLGVAAAMFIAYYFLALVFLMTVRHGVMESNAMKLDQPVLILSTVALGLALIAATFGNYVYGWHFSASLTAWVIPLGTIALIGVLFFDREWNLQPPGTDFGDFQVIYAIFAIFLGVMILTAFAVALSTRFSQVITLILCAGVFMLGLLSEYYFGTQTERGPLYQVLYNTLPNFQYFWFGDALTQDRTISLAHLGNVAAYAGLYVLGVLALGVALFQTREVG